MTMWDQITDGQRETIIRGAIGALEQSHVPEHLREGLIRYLADGILPGGFLQAVLCNNLREAIVRGDPFALAGLPALVEYLRGEFPLIAWGSKERVLAWTTTPSRLEM
jgi:hypothetical protein